jgi:serine/threonine protein kinase
MSTKTNTNTTSTITNLVILRDLPILGTGGSGATVYQGTASIQNVGDNVPVAVKVFPPQAFRGQQTAKDAAISEHNKLRRAMECAPNNFCNVYGYVDDDRDISIVMKKYDGTLLDEMVPNQPLPLKRTINVCLKIAETLRLLHEEPHSFIYLDLKPTNIFIDKQTNTVVLGDFGIARAITNTCGATNPTGGAGGTPRYMSPAQGGAKDFEDSEENSLLTVKCDSWAFGTTLLHMLSGKIPWSEFSIDSQIYGQLYGRNCPAINLPEGTPEALEQLVKNCIVANPRSRPAFQAICNTLQEFNDTFEFPEEEVSEPIVPAPPMATTVLTPPSTTTPNESVDSVTSGQSTSSSNYPSLPMEIQIKLAVYEEQIAAIKTSDASLPLPSIRCNNIENLKTQIETSQSNAALQKKILNKQKEVAETKCNQATQNDEFAEALTFQAEVASLEQQKAALILATANEQAMLQQQVTDDTSLFERGWKLRTEISTSANDCQNEIDTLKVEQHDGFLQKCIELKKSKEAYAALVTQLETTSSVVYFLNSEVLEEAIAAGFNVGTDVEVLDPTEGETKGNDVSLFECGTVTTISAMEAAKVKRDAEAAAEAEEVERRRKKKNDDQAAKNAREWARRRRHDWLPSHVGYGGRYGTYDVCKICGACSGSSSSLGACPGVWRGCGCCGGGGVVRWGRNEVACKGVGGAGCHHT